MKQVYIFGPINLFGKSYLSFYKAVSKLCADYFPKVIATYPDFWNSKETPRQFYNRTLRTITRCNLFIAEISSPSTGVGMELQMAQENNIPIIAVCKKGTKPSVMAIGIPATQIVLYYENLNDLLKQLEKKLSKYDN